MLARNDPRIRRALDQTAQNLEIAGERTREGIYSFTHIYITPCLSATASCLYDCTGRCIPTDDDRRRRQRERPRGRAELNFDFYDDWEEEETDALLGFGHDDPSQSNTRQPQRERTMDYGTRQKSHTKAVARSEEGAQTIPSSSYFGFLDRLPFKIGSKRLKYQPSIADLQDHPASKRHLTAEEEPLLGSDAEDSDPEARPHRARSGTQGSGHTTDSFSSRGDIFPSEDEMDDAVPLDDEFALQLERRTTAEDGSSGKGRASQNPSASHLSLFTLSSRGSTQSKTQKHPAPEEHPRTSRPSERDIPDYLASKASRQQAQPIISQHELDSPPQETKLPSTPNSPTILRSKSASTNESITLAKRNSSTTDLRRDQSISNRNVSSLKGEENAPHSSSTIGSVSKPETFNAARLPHFV